MNIELVVETATSRYAVWTEGATRYLSRTPLRDEWEAPDGEVLPTAKLRLDGEAIPIIGMDGPVVGEPWALMLDVVGDGVTATLRLTTQVVSIEHG